MRQWQLVGWRAAFEWKLQDMWVGWFWKRTGNCVDLWICVLPCVPLHVSWWWTREPAADRQAEAEAAARTPAGVGREEGA